MAAGGAAGAGCSGARHLSTLLSAPPRCTGEGERWPPERRRRREDTVLPATAASRPTEAPGALATGTRAAAGAGATSPLACSEARRSAPAFGHVGCPGPQGRRLRLQAALALLQLATGHGGVDGQAFPSRGQCIRRGGDSSGRTVGRHPQKGAVAARGAGAGRGRRGQAAQGGLLPGH